MSDSQASAVPPWRPERVVDVALASALIGEQFPALATLEVAPLGDGWDNTVFQVGADLAFRFPRRTVALELLETERDALRAIAPHVPVAVPQVLHEGAPSPRYDWPFLGCRLVRGSTLCTRAVQRDALRKLAAPLAQFLAALHSLDVDAPIDTWRRANVGRRRPGAIEQLDRGHALGLNAPSADYANFLDVEFEAREAVLCHGDLYARHLVTDGTGALVGVIDWGDCHRGDRAKDFACAHLVLPIDAHAAFREAYDHAAGPDRAIDDERWEAARALAVFHASMQIVSGVDRRDDGLVAAGQRALSWIGGA